MTDIVERLRDTLYFEPDSDLPEEAAAEIERLRVASEWRDISTAPRDGSWFMVCRDEDGPDSYEVGKWAPYYTLEYEETEQGSGLYRAVMVESTYGWRGFNNMHRATHWQPLPAPPQRNEVTK